MAGAWRNGLFATSGDTVLEAGRVSKNLPSVERKFSAPMVIKVDKLVPLIALEFISVSVMMHLSCR
jgi:hypothetical protein